MTDVIATRAQIQRWRGLRDTAGRRESGAFLVEGPRACAELLGADLEIEALLLEHGAEEREPVRALAQTARRRGVRVFTLARAALERIADTRSPQGILAIARAPLPQAIRQETPLPFACAKGPIPGPAILVWGVQDPGNLGTILRLGWAFGASEVYWTPSCADPFGPKAVRASMGGIFHLVLRPCPDPAAALRAWAKEGRTIVVAAVGGQRPRRPADPARAVLVLGSETHGVGMLPELGSALEVQGIPMAADVDSINVASAAAILLSQWFDAASLAC